MKIFTIKYQKKFAIKAIIALGIIALLYNFCTVSKSAVKYSAEAARIQNETGASNVIIVDFAKTSCSDRLFVFHGRKPIYSGVVLHGNGRESTPSKPEFSNDIGSSCSSLGLFKVVGSKKMRNGYPCLILEGLSPTNSNAEARGILIHPSIMASLLPFELRGASFPLTNASQGCFAVSLHTFNTIKNLDEPIYIYAKYNS